MSDKIVLNLTINLTLDEAYMTAGTISAVLEGMKHAAEENGVNVETEWVSTGASSYLSGSEVLTKAEFKTAIASFAKAWRRIKKELYI